MNYYNPTTKKIGTIDTIRVDNPYSSIPEGAELIDLGYYPIYESQEPNYDAITQGLRFSIEEQHTKIGVQYHRVWSVYELPDDVKEDNIIKNMETIKKSIVSYAEKRLNDFANTKQYDNIQSACSYFGSPVLRFNQDAIDALRVRSLTWEALATIEQEIANGVRPYNITAEELELLLPQLEWSEL